MQLHATTTRFLSQALMLDTVHGAGLQLSYVFSVV